MREIGYVVRGFLTVRRDSLRVPLSGPLTVNADPDSGLFSGDLALHQSTINRAFLGAILIVGPGNAVVIDLIPDAL